jgi:hypothetical protein
MNSTVGFDCERSEHHSLRVETGEQTGTNDFVQSYVFCHRHFSTNGSEIFGYE